MFFYQGDSLTHHHIDKKKLQFSNLQQMQGFTISDDCFMLPYLMHISCTLFRVQMAHIMPKANTATGDAR